MVGWVCGGETVGLGKCGCDGSLRFEVWGPEIAEEEGCAASWMERGQKDYRK